MTELILNIGINNLPPREVAVWGRHTAVQAMVEAFFDIVAHRVEIAPPGGEDTFVARVRTDNPFPPVHNLAKALNQEAIAFDDITNGVQGLAGPNAQAWGSFNEALFFRGV